MKNGCELTKILETPYFNRYCKSTKQNGNVRVTFLVNLSLGCFRIAALLMVMLNMVSRKPMGRVYPENRFKNAKALGSERVKSGNHITLCVTLNFFVK